jgi:hypothetical protein
MEPLDDEEECQVCSFVYGESSDDEEEDEDFEEEEPCDCV